MADEDLSKLKIEKTVLPGGKGRKRKPLYIVLALILLIIIAILAWRGVFSAAPKVEVSTVSLVYPSQAFTVLNASGYVVPQRKAAVASKVTGRIVSLFVEEGSIVKKGQIIARLESDDVEAGRRQAAANADVSRASLQQAKAELQDARTAFEREKNLLAKEFTTKAAYDMAEARYKKASALVAAGEATIKASEAALQGADVSLGYTFVRAPFDAVVLTKNADIGDIVTPIGAAANAKAAVVTIADMDSLHVEADVSESNLYKIKVEQPCEIQLDGIPESRFRGAIHMIVPTADRSKATVMVKVRFIDKDRRVLPEMSAKVAFLSKPVAQGENKPRIAVNNKTLRNKKGNSTVFLISNDRVKEVSITTGEKLGDMVEVLGGVKAGDKVVLNPSEGLRTGLKVKAAQ